MKNKLALKVKAAAEKRLAWVKATWPTDKEMLKGGQKDYEDLMSIAEMFESNVDPKIIGKAMWRLDTAVRDDIPDEAYYFNGRN